MSKRLVISSLPVCLPPQTYAFMPGSPTVEQNLNGVLAQVGAISSQQDAQEFVDVVSGVHIQPFSAASSILSDSVVPPSRSWILIKSWMLG